VPRSRRAVWVPNKPRLARSFDVWLNSRSLREEIFERLHHHELHENEAIVFPIEVVAAAGVPIPKISARILKNKQAAIGSQVNVHIGQVVKRHIERTLVLKRRFVSDSGLRIRDSHHQAL